MNAEEHPIREKRGIRIRTINIAIIALTCLFALLVLQTVSETQGEYAALTKMTNNYIACEKAADDFIDTSEYLSGQARLFTATQKQRYLDSYFAETFTTLSREHSVETIETHYPDSAATDHMQLAYAHSQQLEQWELYAMKLIVHALDLDVDADVAAKLDALPFKNGDEDLPEAEAIEKAHDLVTDEAYEHETNTMYSAVTLCEEELAVHLAEQQEKGGEALSALFSRQQALTWALLIVVVAGILVVVFTVLWPLQSFITQVSRNERLVEHGSYEMRLFSRAYNTAFEEQQKTKMNLIHEAKHDSLTGLYNRGAFEEILNEHLDEPLALAIIDVDLFKEVNDGRGHDCGDHVLQAVASLLASSFRSTDFPCRLGGDEFALIALGITSNRANLIEEKMASIAEQLRVAHDDLPATTLSIGVAFNDVAHDFDTLFKNADLALYRVKEHGRDGIAFYDEDLR